MASASASEATRVVVDELQRLRERRNWLIHELFVRHDHVECLRVIEAQLRASGGMCEYALYVKGLLLRYEGKLTDSLALFSTAVLVGPTSLCSRVQLGRALQLLARYEEAIAAYAEAAALRRAAALDADWQLDYLTGVCYAQQQRASSDALAVGALRRSLAVQARACTYVALARVHLARGELSAALAAYSEAAAATAAPDNADVLAALAQLCLRCRVSSRVAATCLRQCRACVHECAVDGTARASSSSSSLSSSSLAAMMTSTCALLLLRDKGDGNRRHGDASEDDDDNNNKTTTTTQQLHNIDNSNNSSSHDADVLRLYRAALTRRPTSSQLWANVGAMYAAKQRSVHAAVSCLRRALTCNPLDAVAHYNLGLVYLQLRRTVAALHHMTAVVRLVLVSSRREQKQQQRPSQSPSRADVYGGRWCVLAHMYRGVCLSLLNEVDEACAAYTAAILCLEHNEHHCHISSRSRRRSSSDDDDCDDDGDDDDDDEAPLVYLNYAITLWNSGRVGDAAEQLARFYEHWTGDARGAASVTAPAQQQQSEYAVAMRELRYSRRYNVDSLTSLAAYLGECIAAVNADNKDDM